MSGKLIEVPKHETKLTDSLSGQPTGEVKNTFIWFATIAVEGHPHTNDTDAFLAHSIREKLDAWSGQSTLELEEPEILFLQQGVQKLRENQNRGGISGSSWYYLVSALRDAKPKPRAPKQEKK